MALSCRMRAIATALACTECIFAAVARCICAHSRLSSSAQQPRAPEAQAVTSRADNSPQGSDTWRIQDQPQKAGPDVHRVHLRRSRALHLLDSGGPLIFTVLGS